MDCYIDLYFPEYRLAIEIDEKRHLDRDENKEEEIENKTKETLKCRFFRINPDREKFAVFVEIHKIYDIIDKIKEKRKNESIDMIKRRHKKETKK